MEGTLFWMGFIWQEEVHLSRTEAQFLQADFGFGTSETLIR